MNDKERGHLWQLFLFKRWSLHFDKGKMQMRGRWQQSKGWWKITIQLSNQETSCYHWISIIYYLAGIGTVGTNHFQFYFESQYVGRGLTWAKSSKEAAIITPAAKPIMISDNLRQIFWRWYIQALPWNNGATQFEPHKRPASNCSAKDHILIKPPSVRDILMIYSVMSKGLLWHLTFKWYGRGSHSIMKTLWLN